MIDFTEKFVKLVYISTVFIKNSSIWRNFWKWHWIFSLGKWHWFLAISKFSLGKKVNAKIMISRKKVFCTTKFFPLVYLANHVEIHMWSLQNFCITVFWKNFRENTSLVKRFTLNLISWNISQVIQNFVNSTLCTALQIVAKWKIFRQINSDNLFVKTLLSRNFC